MLTDQHIEEGLSRAYLQAIAAKAGLILSFPHPDYGIDATVHEVAIINRRRRQSGFSLDCQLKASIRCIVTGGFVVYDLEAKTYNDLVDRRSWRNATACILVVMCLPPNSEEWLEHGEASLILHGACYWDYLEGEPSRNTKTVRIRIPRDQQLTPEALKTLSLE